jgi:hypothetical protein
LVGRMNTIRSSIVTAVQGVSNIYSCQASPTSGSITASGLGTLTFGKAQYSPPTNWPRTGVYDRRVTISGGPTDGLGNTTSGFYEFYCDYPGAAAVLITKNTAGTEINRQVIYYDGSTATNKYLDFYIWDAGMFSFTGTGSELELAGQLRVLANNKYRLAITRTGLATAAQTLTTAYRFVVHGDSSTQLSSFVFYDRSSADAGTLVSTLTPQGNYTAKGIVAAQAPALGCSNSTLFPCGGCAPDWNTSFNAIASITGCPGGSAPILPDSPAFDSSGDFSFSYLLGSFKAKLQALN